MQHLYPLCGWEDGIIEPVCLAQGKCNRACSSLLVEQSRNPRRCPLVSLSKMASAALTMKDPLNAWASCIGSFMLPNVWASWSFFATQYISANLALVKEMATHSSVLAWRIPGTAEPGGPLSVGLHRVRQDWSYLAAAAVALVFLWFP